MSLNFHTAIIASSRRRGGVTAYRDAVLADSPVAYWRLNGSTLVDSSGNELSGTYYNTPSTGQAGPTADSDSAATLFNGSTQYGEIAHNVLMDVTAWTLECWVKWATTPPDLATLIGRPVSLSPIEVPYRFLKSGSQVEANYFNNNAKFSLLQSTPITTGVWHHYAATVTIEGPNHVIRAYRDGVEVDSSTSTDPVPVRISSFFIGAEDDRRFVNAHISEVALYSSPLSAARILAHYNAAT